MRVCPKQSLICPKEGMVTKLSSLNVVYTVLSNSGSKTFVDFSGNKRKFILLFALNRDLKWRVFSYTGLVF